MESVSQAAPEFKINSIRKDTDRIWGMVQLLERMAEEMDEKPALEAGAVVLEAESILSESA